MSLNVWVRDDIKNTLLALNEASGSLALRISSHADDVYLQAYRDGYADALRAVAVAFGIMIPTPPDPLPEALRLPRHWIEVEDDDVDGACTP